MKKLILLSFFILFAAYSCSVNRPLYAKSDNAKELILLKYGNPSKVENQEEKEKWIYNYSSQFKSNRTVVFDNADKIITNKKHYKVLQVIIKYKLLAMGTVLILYLIAGPFPALL